MKNFLLFILTLPLFVYGQEKPIEGFMGVKFGTAKLQVEAAMKAKGGELISSASTDHSLFTGIVFAKRKTYFISTRYINNQFYEATAYFKADENEIVAQYKAMIEELNSNYGKGKEIRDYSDSFKEGDGYELLGLQTGKTNYFTTWVTKNANGDKNTIRLDIYRPSPEKEPYALQIALDYSDGTISKIADAKTNQEKSKDY